MPPTAKQILENVRAKVWPVYKPYLPKGDDEFSRMVRDYPERKGKYGRAALICLSNELFGGKPENAYLTAAAYQAGEDWILIHDDIHDESEERRHKPCLHKIHGEKHAINAGDALHMIMWKMLRGNRKLLGEDLSRTLEDMIHETLFTTTRGQHVELNWIKNNSIDVSAEDYFYKVDIISGLYTIITPLQLGAMIAGASESDLQKIVKFAKPLGRAFQIRDDVLNLLEKEEYGKETYGDIYEGKRTLVLSHLVRNCTADEKQKLSDIYSKKRKDKIPEEVSYVVNLMRKYGSIEYAQKVAEDYAEEALNIFDKEFLHLPDTQTKQDLRTLIEYMAKREK
jgi:geranylgeranyl diphosphate synthase type II